MGCEQLVIFASRLLAVLGDSLNVNTSVYKYVYTAQLPTSSFARTFDVVVTFIEYKSSAYDMLKCFNMSANR